MKLLFKTLLIINVFVSFGQDYIFTNFNREIIDVPGDNFLSYYANNTHIVVEEHLPNQQTFWKDSVVIPYAEHNALNGFLNSFKLNDNEYLIFYANRVTDLDFYHLDTIGLLTIKVSLSNQSIVNSKILKLDNRNHGKPYMIDNRIFINALKREQLQPQGYTQKMIFYEMDEDLNLQYVPDSDTLIFYDSYKFRSAGKANDTIYQYFAQNGAGYVTYSSFDTSLQRYDSHINSTFPTFPISSNYYYYLPQLYIRNNNPDSILYSSFVTQNQDQYYAWSMKWLNKKLQEKKSLNKIMSSNTSDVNVIMHKDTIYVISRFDNEEVTISKYDIEFNYICSYSPSFHYTNPNDYKIVIVNDKVYFMNRNSNGNYVMTLLNLCDPLGVDDLVIENLTINPNPFSDHITIDSKIEGPYQLEIYNLEGKVIFQEAECIGSTQINTSMLNSGMYLIKIYNGDRFLTKKMVKH